MPMPESIFELLLTEIAEAKIGRRGISDDEVRQLLFNAYVMVENPRSVPKGARWLMIGRTDGGRVLTAVVERTVDRTTWILVTAWDSGPAERKLLSS